MVSALTSGICVGDSGNNESSLVIFHDRFTTSFHDQFSNKQLDRPSKNVTRFCLATLVPNPHDNATADELFHASQLLTTNLAGFRAHDYFASSFLPASRLSKFRIALNTMK